MMKRWTVALALSVLLGGLLVPALPAWAQAWRDAYLRGLDLIDEGRFAEAVRLFDQAIAGNPKEDRQTRLYGMRYGYFPHRDKGIALYKLGDWDAAVQALEESARQGASPESARYRELARNRQTVVEAPQVFRGTWWDYYERGLLYAQSGNWRAAVDDFRAARRGREQEGRAARTYGVRFIEYFPVRELGVVLFHDGRYQEAVEALERSLGKLPTAKATYYLNLARAALLKRSAPDRNPPRIKIEVPSDGLLTNTLALEVRGLVESRNLVGELAINQESFLIDVAPPALPFAQPIVLTPGRNLIEVVARDLTKLENRVTLSVIVDREGPVVVIDKLARTPAGHFRVEGTVYDNVRLGSLEVNGQRVALAGAAESPFVAELAALPPALPIEAADAAGNVTRIRLPVPAELRQQGRAPWPGSRAAAPRPAVGWLLPGVRPLAWADAVAHGADVVPVVFHTKDTLAIEMEAPPTEVQQDTITLNWIVMAPAPLVSVKVNAEEKTLRQTEPGRPLVFSHVVDLAEGPNTFTITALDKNGKTVAKSVRIVRKGDDVEQVGSRLSVAVMPFAHKSKASDFYETVDEAMTDALVNQRRFKIVSRAQLEAILKELKLSRSELVNQATAVRAGKLVAAEAILVSAVTEHPNSAVEVFTQLIDTETSTVLAAKDVYDPAKGARTAQQKMRELATKLKQEYPLAVGAVVSVLNKRLAVALGSQKKMREQMRVIVFAEGEPIVDPQTKIVLDRNIESLGEGTLNEVRAQVSFAVIKTDDLVKVERLVTQKKPVKIITK